MVSPQFRQRIKIIIFTALSIYAQFDSATFNKTTGPLKITRITPAGEDVHAERQIVIKFNMPMEKDN
ncbi:MAG: hypothetical protein ACMUJM_02810 [bacterium]